MEKRLLEIFEKIDRKLEAECGRVGEKIPYTTQNGLYQADMRDENLSWWTNGFWAGMLWQMYGKRTVLQDGPTLGGGL